MDETPNNFKNILDHPCNMYAKAHYFTTLNRSRDNVVEEELWGTPYMLMLAFIKLRTLKFYLCSIKIRFMFSLLT